MRKKLLKLFCVFYFQLILVACTSVAEDKCITASFRKDHPQYVYTGPISFESAKLIYEREAYPYANEKMLKAWEDFSRSSSDSKCIFLFDTSEEDWKLLRGVKGLASFSEGEILDAFIIMRN